MKTFTSPYNFLWGFLGISNFHVYKFIEFFLCLHCCCSVAKLCLTLCNPMDCSMPGFLVLHYLPEFAQTHVHFILCCPQSFPVSGSFSMSWLFTSGGQSIGASASALVLPMNIQDWFPLGWTGLISLQSTGLWRVFSSTTVQKHPFFDTKLSLWSNSHIHIWLLEKA